jgi:hypothetical protein
LGATTQKALCVSTRCTSVDQFVATFYRFCEDDTFFIATLSQRPVGLDTPFSIQLADKTPVLRGDCTIIEAWSTPINRFGRPGVRLALNRLTGESRLVLQRLQEAAAAAPKDSAVPTAEIPASPPPIPQVRASSPVPRAATVPPRLSVTTTQPLPSISIPERAPTNPPPPRPPATPVPSIARGTTKSAPIADAFPLEPTKSPLSGLAKTLEAQRASRRTDAPPPAPPPPTPPAPIIELVQPIVREPAKIIEARVEERVAGSSFVLPANPLSNLTDQSIEGFVDCALYEERANFVHPDGTPDVLESIDNVVTIPPPMGHPSTIPPPMGHPSTIPPPMGGRPTTIPPPFAGGYPQPGMSGQFLMPMASPEMNPMPVASMSGVYPMPPPGMSGPFYLPQPGMSGQFLMPQAPPPMAPPPSEETYLRTGVMRAVSAPSDRRWYVIGGAAGATMLLLIIIGVATSGGSKPAVKVASAETPRAMTSKAPVRKSSPDVEMAKVEPPPVETPPAEVAKVAVPPPVETPPPVEPTEPEETAPTSDAPPEVGSGPCNYVVSTTPAGSIVSFDGRIMGPSPLTIHGACGRHRLDVRHARYALGTKFATATEAKAATVEIPLARPTHTVAFTTIPSGATISIGGRRAGTSPTTIKVMGFQGMNVTFERKGFKKVTQKLYSKKDNERVTVRLTK